MPASDGGADVDSSPTTVPAATAPGCHVAVARPSTVTTAPAAPAGAASEPLTAAGIGAAVTTAVVGAAADWEPLLAVAVTTSDIVAPMSPGVSE